MRQFVSVTAVKLVHRKDDFQHTRIVVRGSFPISTNARAVSPKATSADASIYHQCQPEYLSACHSTKFLKPKSLNSTRNSPTDLPKISSVSSSAQRTRSTVPGAAREVRSSQNCSAIRVPRGSITRTVRTTVQGLAAIAISPRLCCSHVAPEAACRV